MDELVLRQISKSRPKSRSSSLENLKKFILPGFQNVSTNFLQSQKNRSVMQQNYVKQQKEKQTDFCERDAKAVLFFRKEGERDKNVILGKFETEGMRHMMSNKKINPKCFQQLTLNSNQIRSNLTSFTQKQQSKPQQIKIIIL